MPFIGALSIFRLRRVWGLASPLLVFAASYVWQFITGIIHGGSGKSAVVGALPYSAIYACLTLVGVVIGWLLQYAFKKEMR